MAVPPLANVADARCASADCSSAASEAAPSSAARPRGSMNTLALPSLRLATRGSISLRSSTSSGLPEDRIVGSPAPSKVEKDTALVGGATHKRELRRSAIRAAVQPESTVSRTARDPHVIRERNTHRRVPRPRASSRRP
eukprot:4463909-Prymnesium_polylepis.2